MKNIITIFKKEFLDLSRDKRTMRTMIFIPLLLYPVLITIVSKFMQNQTENAIEQGLRIGVINNGNENVFLDFTENVIQNVNSPNVENGIVIPPKIIRLSNDTAQIKDLIDVDSIDAAYWFSASFDSSLAQMRPADYKMFYNSSSHEFKSDMIINLDEAFKDYIVDMRFKNMQLNKDIVNPFTDNSNIDLASAKEKTGAVIGGILPYFFIIFCLLGCMYPGIDMAAGEKERGTLETLLVSSASRLEIFTGKFLVVASCGFISACMALAGMFLAVKLNSEIPSEITSTIFNVLTPASIAMILSLMIPLNLFFASVILTLSIWAKSFKEAQTLVSPLMIIAVIPSMIGMLPGIKHDMFTAWIPILNVSLGAKAIISGSVQTLPLLITYVSLVLVAGIGIVISVKFFNNEKNILRG